MEAKPWECDWGAASRVSSLKPMLELFLSKKRKSKQKKINFFRENIL